MQILIYNDQGVSREDLPELEQSLCKLSPCGGVSVGYTNAADISSGKLAAGCKLLVVPGGMDLPYCAQLNGVGNKQIKEFVEHGGSFLGICAGAYYGASIVEFDQGGSLEVIGERELGFFRGKAVGPAFGVGTYQYGSFFGARVVKLEISPLIQNDINNGFAYSHFNGGCFFVPDADNMNKGESFEILARYSEIEGSPAAIVETRPRNGRAILCGVHPEIGSKFLASLNAPMANRLAEVEQCRQALLRALLERLL